MTAIGRWWYGYWVAPWGAIPAAALWSTSVTIVAYGSQSFTSSLGAAYWFSIVGVLTAYGVGLSLLPVFLLYELAGWRSWKAYVPTGLVVGILTIVLMANQPPQLLSVQFLTLGGLCGTLCAVVFSLRLAAADSNEVMSLQPR